MLSKCFLRCANVVAVPVVWSVCLQGGPKMAQFVLNTLTLSNINRFSEFFYCRNREKICINIIDKDPTTPQNVLLHYLVPCEMSGSHGFDWRVKNGEDWHRLR